MIKLILWCILVLLSTTSVYAFDDIPGNHWAREAVNSLVQQGVTTGFPDGTFRGNQAVSRYEMAAMLAKIPANLQAEKVLAELKTELASAKYKKEQYAPKSSWNAQLRLLSGQEVLKSDYRLQASYSQPLGPGRASLALDTLDSGYNSAATRDFMQLLKLELTGSKNNIKYLFTAGSGDILHQETLVPSENQLVFPGIYPAAGLSANFDDIDIEAVIRARNVSASGKVGFTEIDTHFSHAFNNIELALRPRYFMGPTANNFRMAASVYQAASPFFNQTLSLDVGYAHNFPHGLAASYSASLKNENTQLFLDIKKLGSNFRGIWNYYILNIFDRAILDGAYDGGIKLTQKLNGQSSLYIIENINSNYSTTQFGYQCKPFEIFYRLYNVPTGNDGYRTVSVNSTLIGLEISL